MKKLLLFIVIGIALLLPSASFAAEEKFYEFAADAGVPVEVPSGSVAVQEVKIYSDFIDAVDLWYDNAGSSGSVSVALLSASNNVLTSKTVTAAHATVFYTGQRLHVTFPDTITIASGSWYKIRITSSVPQLRLYGIPRVQFVEHNAPATIADAVGGATVDGDSRLSAFKFALYEEIDTEGPIITNASSSVASPDSMKISFNANELVDRNLTYTPIGSGNVSTVYYIGNYSVCFAGILTCSLTIDTQRETLYTYRLSVRDSMGNASYYDGAFESWRPGTPTPPTDPTAPPATPPAETPPPSEEPPAAPLTITNGRVVAVTYVSVQLSWDTDRAANSTLIISSDPVGSQIVSNIADGTYELVHTLSTGSGITAGTNYYATIISRDEQGIMDADVIPFTSGTIALPSKTTEAPVVSPTAVLQTSVSNEQGSAFISWDVPSGGEPSNGYRIDIIDAQGNLVETSIVPAGTHSVDVSGLTGGEYRVIAYGDNEGVVEKVAEPAVISVRKRAEPIDTYELIKKPIVYVPFVFFVMLIAGLYWYGKRQKHIEK